MNKSDQISSPIFIVGPSRSGTTWLKCMMAVHNELYTIPETKFYQYVLKPKKKLKNKDFYPITYFPNPEKISPEQLKTSLNHLVKLKLIDQSNSVSQGKV